MIQVRNLTKRYGPTLAVDDLSFDVRPGSVTGFLGPNGSGKSTTMRVILGLDLPDGGEALVGGRPYRRAAVPLAEVGALLDAGAVHPGRSARNHLLALARSNRLPDRRVDEVLELVGLGDAAGRRAGGFSLGMRQRLGIAVALLGDPPVLLLDEPVNGLDTEGIRWIRGLLTGLAAEGRAVLVSSHLMSEMELMAERLVVIGRGRLVADTTVTALVQAHSRPVTRVRTPQPDELRRALGDVAMEPQPDGAWRVTGSDPARIGDLAAGHGIALHELTPVWSSLEEAYTLLTESSVEYRAGAEVSA